MKELIVYIAQSSICIGIFFLVYRLFLRSTTFFVFNRMFLVSGLVASFIIPSIRFSYEVIVPASISASTEASEAVQPTHQTSSIDIWFVLSAIYIIGIAVQLIRNVASYRKMIRVMRSGQMTQSNGYKLVDSEDVKSPFTVLNCIAINTKNMTEIEKDLIIKHETTHIYQKHWIDLLCSECALLLQWFNPLMWFYVSSQKENHEFLADKAVIDSGISPVVYQAALINQRFQGPVFSFSNSFNYPNQLNRLFMIKKAKTSSWRKVAVLALIPSFGLFFWASAAPHYTFSLADKNLIEIVQETGQRNDDIGKVLYIIDGETASHAEMRALKPSEIEKVDVLKAKTATELYGEKGKNGVIIISTKRAVESKPDKPLVVIDGKIDNLIDLQTIDPNTIELMNVLKGEDARAVYGEEGVKNGVVEIILKK